MPPLMRLSTAPDTRPLALRMAMLLRSNTSSPATLSKGGQAGWRASVALAISRAGT